MHQIVLFFLFSSALCACGGPAPRTTLLRVPSVGEVDSQATAIGVNDFVVAAADAFQPCVFTRVTIGLGDESLSTRLGFSTHQCGTIAGFEGVLWVAYTPADWGRPVVQRVDFGKTPPKASEVLSEVMGQLPIETEPGRLFATGPTTLWHLGDIVQRSDDGGASWIKIDIIGYSRSLYRALGTSNGSVYVASLGLFRVQGVTATRVETGIYSVKSLHGDVVVGSDVGKLAIGRLDGDRVIWDPVDPDWGEIKFAWSRGNVIRLLSRPEMDSPADVASGPEYRARRNGGSWGSTSLGYAASPPIAVYGVDPLGNALIPRVHQNIWYLPANDGVAGD